MMGSRSYQGKPRPQTITLRHYRLPNQLLTALLAEYLGESIQLSRSLSSILTNSGAGYKTFIKMVWVKEKVCRGLCQMQSGAIFEKNIPDKSPITRLGTESKNDTFFTSYSMLCAKDRFAFLSQCVY